MVCTTRCALIGVPLLRIRSTARTAGAPAAPPGAVHRRTVTAGEGGCQEKFTKASKSKAHAAVTDERSADLQDATTHVHRNLAIEQVLGSNERLTVGER